MPKTHIQTLIGTMLNRPLIYIAGPYTRPDPVRNTHRVVKIANALMRLHVTPIVPHLSMLWHLVRPKPYKFWLEYDLQLLARADAVLCVPGPSEGANVEVTHARQLRIPVLHPASARVQDCVSAVRDWVLHGGSHERGPD